MPSQYTVNTAAAALSVSPSTVRRIADDYAAFMPDYQPLPGEPRRFSRPDILAISAILSRLNSRPGLTRAALLRELSEPGSEPLIIPAELSAPERASPQERPREPIDSPAIQTDVKALADVRRLIEPLSALPGAVERMADRIAALESLPAPASPPARPGALSIVAQGVAVGVLLGALVMAAIWPGSTAALVVAVGVAIVAILVSIIAPLRR